MTKSHVKEMSQARFAALTFATNSSYHEIAWFSDMDEHFLATIFIDWTDEDYHYVILARDEAHVFRCIASGESFENAASAISALFIKLDSYIQSPKKIYPQGEAAASKQNDIFGKIVDEAKLNKNFIQLRDTERLSAAKELIQEIARSFIEIDGKFFRTFQQDGFDQRTWELYLYAYLHEEGFTFDRKHPSPDYVCIKEPYKICVEATTINPPNNIQRETQSLQDVFIQNSEYTCIKLRKALNKKLIKRYWELPHVQGYSLVLAIQSFENFGDCTSILNYLYGVSHSWTKDKDGQLIITPEKITEHKHKQSHAKSGFFFQPDTENISAILFSNSGTTSKFNRMGKLAGFGSPRVHLWRIGTCFNYEPNATQPKPFAFEIEPDKYQETWAQGISMIHNPNALLPINPELFPSIAHHFFDNGQIVSRSIEEFQPLTSITLNI